MSKGNRGCRIRICYWNWPEAIAGQGKVGRWNDQWSSKILTNGPKAIIRGGRGRTDQWLSKNLTKGNRGWRIYCYIIVINNDNNNFFCYFFIVNNIWESLLQEVRCMRHESFRSSCRTNKEQSTVALVPVLLFSMRKRTELNVFRVTSDVEEWKSNEISPIFFLSQNAVQSFQKRISESVGWALLLEILT